MLTRNYLIIALLLFHVFCFSQRSFHVSSTTTANGNGSITPPLKTIQSAANLAQPGDTIIVHAGIYRERIDPPRSGSINKPIIYQASFGERVIIKGSEIQTNWKKIASNIYSLTLPNTYFGDFNPYKDEIKGDWYDGKGWKQHTGAVYVNGHWLMECPSKEELKNKTNHWFAEVNNTSTIIYANFGDIDPAKNEIEINVRQSIFYPKKTGINYITVSGFIMQHAATNWAPPTAEQVGLIGTNWSKGWIIENNEISYSKCSGITLGKYGDEYDNTSANSAEGYVETVKRALKHGWHKDSVGSHIVRNNTISFCEQAGIVGSLGCSFSTVSGNTIHDIHMQRLFNGAEQSAIKFHGAVDLTISNNIIYHNNRGIWLDWMAQGARLSGNLLYDHDDWDIYFEVDHGPILVDNNIMLSDNSQRVWSQGVAYVHNYIGGKFEAVGDGRLTPVLEPHGTKMLSLVNNPIGDVQFYNNIFNGPLCQVSVFGEPMLSVRGNGNVYTNGASAPRWDRGAVTDSTGEVVKLSVNSDLKIPLIHYPLFPSSLARPVFTSAQLDSAFFAKQAFETPDKKVIEFDTDFYGKQHLTQFPGPLQP